MKKIIPSLILFLSIVTINAQDKKELNIKYRRSSLHTLMVENPAIPHATTIKLAFEKGPIPEKFNDHIVGSRMIPTDNQEDQTTNIKNYLETNNVAKQLVAKWFNRSANGAFNMDLIKSRGSYDASVVDIATAKASKRGLEMLADAGEELIKNTFVLINDYKYVSKEEVAKKASGLLKSVGSFASYVPGGGNVAVTTNVAATGVTVAGKGYVVKTTAHLYRLEWNDEVAATFYNDYWADDKTITAEKKKAFDHSNIFKLVYVGSDVSWADVQSTIFTQKTDDELIERATIKAVDAVIVELQKNHDEFKTKTPLFTGEPITAKIGVKEGVNTKSKFDVLEQQIDENGKTNYVVVGSVKVDEDFPIWDNRYGAEEENPDSKTDRTYFKKVSGKEFYPGMLIVQKKGK
ncbi:MAG: hypothetical protein V4670_10260 [Bacteroidota bacterium]